MLIQATNERLFHGGVQDTLTQLRERYWILRRRETVRKVLHSCFACCHCRLRPETAPIVQLTRERITETSPFQVTEVHFCGLLYLRGQTEIRLTFVLFHAQSLWQYI